MSEWQRLSERRGINSKFEPVEGFPAFLASRVRHPLMEFFTGSTVFADRVALELRISFSDTGIPGFFELWNEVVDEDDKALDVIDLMCDVAKDETNPSVFSQAVLISGLFDKAGSVWRADVWAGRLETRLSEETQSMFAAAVAPDDTSSEYINYAWKHAFGRSPEALQAWNEATRALEELMKPLIAPKDGSTTWGKLKGAVKAAPQKWDASMPGDNAAERVMNLHALMERIPYSPKRHGGDEKDAPTLEVARSMVLIATSLIAVIREGGLWRV